MPEFFDAADRIAADLTAKGPSEDELNRVTEPMRNLINRALSGHRFWMDMLEGSTADPRRIAALRTLMTDYTDVTPDDIKALAQQYLVSRKGWRVAVIPDGEQLATRAPGTLASP